jgi:hypothetical protein
MGGSLHYLKFYFFNLIAAKKKLRGLACIRETPLFMAKCCNRLRKNLHLVGRAITKPICIT